MLKNIWLSTLIMLSLNGCSEDTFERVPPKFNNWSLSAENTSWFEVLTYKDHHSELTPHQHHQIKKLVALTDDESSLYARIQVNILKNHRDKVAQMRIKSIMKLLKSYGLKAHRIEVIYLNPAEHASQPEENSHKITVVLDQYKLNIPDCSQVKRLDTRHDDLEAAQGCANIRNQALMIAEPRDVYRAQEKAPTDSILQNMAVDNYRLDKVKPIDDQKTSTSK